jgi:hypothetical protein
VKKPLLLLLVAWSYHAYTQSSITDIGARAQGLGYTASCLSDAWSTLNNPAGLAKQRKPIAACTYDAFAGFSPFNRLAAVVAVPTSAGTIGAGVYRFGDNLYNEHLLTAAFANTLGIASLGGRIHYIQYHADGLGTRGLISLSAGGITQLTPTLLVGAYINNLFQPTVDRENNEQLPTRLTLGTGITLSENVLWTAEATQDLGHATTWKTGLEYTAQQTFIFRVGVNLSPDAYFAGMGFRRQRFLLDYAFQHLPGLGMRHQTAVGYYLSQPTTP